MMELRIAFFCITPMLARVHLRRDRLAMG
jgi:hypothetical protein